MGRMKQINLTYKNHLRKIYHFNNKPPMSNKKYICNSCSFSTNSSKDWKRHLDTKKHQKLTEKNTNCNEWQCPVCNTKFGSRTTLWRHKKTCDEAAQPIVLTQSSEEVNIMCDDVNKLFLDAITENTRLQKEILEQSKALAEKSNVVIGNNNNNNYININMFLNEECANAMSLQTFAKKLSLTIEDLHNKSLREGLTNIVIKNLQPLSLTERPVHCKDKSEWYIKDEAKGWNEDSGEKLLKAASFGIQCNWVEEFEKRYPEWMKSDSLKDMYIQLAGTSSTDISDKDKMAILQRISAEVNLNNENVV
tara:strand:+ start:302 stop:1222 length:921 start_codon:yes stop_codon:yes gene_type:complete